MKLRKYQIGDCVALAELFFNTVHTINAVDYTEQQLAAWATGTVDLGTWEQSFLAHDTIVAEESGVLVGFGDMDAVGYLDRLFVHQAYQGQGVATAILSELERNAVAHGIRIFSTASSITAKPFFVRRGYRIISERVVARGEVTLTNFLMEKDWQGE